MSIKKSKNEQKKPRNAIKNLDEFLGMIEALALEIPLVMVATELNDATIEGVVFSDEGDYVDGQALGDGVYVVLGLGKVDHALEPGVHICPRILGQKESKQ